MNYYEHHIGDYDANTAHLSWIEDLAYTRLIRMYYRKEKPIPESLVDVCRLIRATSREQKKAVEAVLNEFFILREDGWHQDRCDEEIAAYQAGEPEREAKKANEETRTKRHRAERAELFKVLTDAGQHAPWNINIKDLRDLAATLQAPKPVTPVTPPETENPEPETPPVTAPATPVTATQTPDPIPNTHTQYITTLSGNPDDAPSRPQALEVLEYLNTKSGRNYRAVDVNLDLVLARLKSGATVAQCKAIVDAKVTQWGEDQKMQEYLRPGTLFNRTRFEQYLGQLGDDSASTDQYGIPL